jgi:hypothetical protein
MSAPKNSEIRVTDRLEGVFMSVIINSTADFISPRVAIQRHGISRARLKLAIKNGEIAVRHTGVNRSKVREADVLRILTGAEQAPAGINNGSI